MIANYFLFNYNNKYILFQLHSKLVAGVTFKRILSTQSLICLFILLDLMRCKINKKKQYKICQNCITKNDEIFYI